MLGSGQLAGRIPLILAEQGFVKLGDACVASTQGPLIPLISKQVTSGCDLRAVSHSGNSRTR